MLPSKYLRKGWTQHNIATDNNNNPIQPHNKRAYKWCMIGSLDVSYHFGGVTSNIRDEIEEILLDKIKLSGYDFIEDYNDDENRKHTEVIFLMDQVEKEVLKKYKINTHYNRFR